ncbi:WD40-repeat-containing domain protein [Lipomyces oligophaga]|uniref:WD40-repeat-containing domain protein n=1 Tax=Lipomyces oligophaga TaxID=45792 RepID=UPI0034CF7D0F
MASPSSLDSALISLTCTDHPTDIFAVATSPKLVVSATGDSKLRVWNALSSDHELVREISTSHRVGIHHVSVSSQADLLAAVGFDGSISVWTLSSGDHLITLSDPKVTFWAVSLASDGQYLAATTIDGNISVFARDDQGFVSCGYLETKGTPGLCVDYSNDGLYIASGHENGGLYIFSTETALLIHSLAGHVKSVRSVAFSPSSRLLAAAGDSRIVTVYSVKSGEMVFTLPGHSRWIMSLDWNFNGEHIITSSFDQTLKVWSIENRECVATQNEAEGPVWTAKWTKTDGTGRPQGFVSAGTDKVLRWYREASGT